MAFDAPFAERARGALAGTPGLSEKRMFGGLAFLWQGHMFAGLVGGDLMVRVGPAAHAAALALPHARPMDFTGRPMQGYVFVAPAGTARGPDLSAWLERGLSFARTLPPKRARPARTSRRNPR